MYNTTLDPRIYQKKVEKEKKILYMESAHACNAISTDYKNGIFHAEFESHNDLEDFARTLQARNLPF